MSGSTIRRGAFLAGALVSGVLGFTGVAEAGTITLHRDTGSSGYTGSNGGGEFGVTQFDGTIAPISSPVKVGTNVFQTFCIEGNEEVPLDTQVLWSEGDSAHAGGNGGATNGADPLSAQSAYLFSQFWHGTLTSYNYTLGSGRESSATDLQNALWYLEDELLGSSTSGPGGHLGWNYLSSTAQGWVNDAFTQTASGGSWYNAWGNTIGNVRVLTLTTVNGGALQDVLVLIPVPLPPAALLGLGLASMIGLGAYVRRSRMTKAL